MIRNFHIKLINNVICKERFVIVCVNSVAFISVYLPCKSTVDYINLVHDTIDLLDMHLKLINPVSIVMGGDLNLDLRSRSDICDYIRNFSNDFDLVECSTIATPSVDYTFHNSLGHRTWIDWFLISNNLSHSVTSYDILDVEPNLSDHLPIICDIIISGFQFVPKLGKTGQHEFRKLKLIWDKSNLSYYYEASRSTLQPILDILKPSYDSLINDFVFSHANHFVYADTKNAPFFKNVSSNAIQLIDRFYPLIVDALNFASACAVPKAKCSFAKHWWTEELQDLKNRSIDSHQIWVNAGRPRSGFVFDIYKKDKYSYKLLIRKEKENTDLTITNDLHEALCCKDVTGFWKTWNCKLNHKQNDQPKIVGGIADSVEISNAFASFFTETCKPNSVEKHDNLRVAFENKYKSYSGDYLTSDDFFTVEQINKAVVDLKVGKAAGYDGIMAEHLLYSHPSALILITYLCNLILLTLIG